MPGWGEPAGIGVAVLHGRLEEDPGGEVAAELTRGLADGTAVVIADLAAVNCGRSRRQAPVSVIDLFNRRWHVVACPRILAMTVSQPKWFAPASAALIRIGGCEASNIGYNGTSYLPDWPNGTARRPTPYMFTSTAAT